MSTAVSFLIWTTTPWTLPANVAIALRPDASYGLYRVGGELLIVAEALAQAALGERFAEATLLASARGDALDDLAVRHPFLDRDSAIVLADYVDLETGTGAVHTAPGHGADDFDTGVKYGLPILNPVDAAGRFTLDAGPYAGQHIFKANAQIVEDLRASGALWSAAEYEHSYPHCWRCHNPVIFRATSQWFIAMDQNLLRARTMDAIEGVEYTPAWGRTRQRQMIETHPEWCSRVSAPGGRRSRRSSASAAASRCSIRKSRGSPPSASARRVRARGGAIRSRSYLPAGFACPRCDGDDVSRKRRTSSTSGSSRA